MGSKSIKRPDILITNGEHRAGLTLVRALGKKNLRVQVSGNHKKSPSFYSKYAYSSFSYSNITNKIKNSHKVILKNIKKFRPKVFMPILDDALMVYYNNQEAYAKYTNIIPLPAFEKFNYLNTKENYIYLAKKKKVDIPCTYVCKNIHDAKKAIKNLSFPLIIKPNIGYGSQGVSLIHNKEDFLIKFHELKKQKSSLTFNPEKIIVQEYIPDTLSYFNVLLQNGKVIAKQQIRIIKTYPAICGGPACSISTFDNHLDKIGNKVLDKIKVKDGALNIQFIFDKKNKTYKLLEINPRIWGSIQSSIDTGVNFPYLLYKIAIGEKVNPVKNYVINKKVNHFTSEFKSCLEKKNLSEFIDCLNIAKSPTEFKLTDLKPNIIELINETYNFFK